MTTRLRGRVQSSLVSLLRGLGDQLAGELPARLTRTFEGSSESVCAPSSTGSSAGQNLTANKLLDRLNPAIHQRNRTAFALPQFGLRARFRGLDKSSPRSRPATRAGLSEHLRFRPMRPRRSAFSGSAAHSTTLQALRPVIASAEPDSLSAFRPNSPIANHHRVLSAVRARRVLRVANCRPCRTSRSLVD